MASLNVNIDSALAPLLAQALQERDANAHLAGCRLEEMRQNSQQYQVERREYQRKIDKAMVGFRAITSTCHTELDRMKCGPQKFENTEALVAFTVNTMRAQAEMLSVADAANMKWLRELIGVPNADLATIADQLLEWKRRLAAIPPKPAFADAVGAPSLLGSMQEAEPFKRNTKVRVRTDFAERLKAFYDAYPKWGLRGLIANNTATAPGVIFNVEDEWDRDTPYLGLRGVPGSPLFGGYESLPVCCVELVKDEVVGGPPPATDPE